MFILRRRLGLYWRRAPTQKHGRYWGSYYIRVWWSWCVYGIFLNLILWQKLEAKNIRPKKKSASQKKWFQHFLQSESLLLGAGKNLKEGTWKIHFWKIAGNVSRLRVGDEKERNCWEFSSKMIKTVQLLDRNFHFVEKQEVFPRAEAVGVFFIKAANMYSYGVDVW